MRIYAYHSSFYEKYSFLNLIFKNYNYLCDTHTAVGIKVCCDYMAKTGDNTPVVIASPASPYTCCASVLSAVSPEEKETDEFKLLTKLEEKTGVSAPAQLKGLKDKAERFNKVCEKDVDSMRKVVFDMLGIK